jgi:hypothetical protein
LQLRYRHRLDSIELEFDAKRGRITNIDECYSVPPAVSGTPIWSLPNDGDQEKLLLHPMAKWTGFDPQGPSAPGGRDALNDMARRFAARQTVSDDALAAATRA